MPRKYIFTFVAILFASFVRSQDDEGLAIDEAYLEDQFYIGLSYNFLATDNAIFTQRNFSYNLKLGFIRDMPLNAQRNIALGLGFGYAANSYYTNLLVTETDQGLTYAFPEAIDFKRGKLETHALEVPFEIRWRNSNPIDYRFWRIYAGAKLSYNFLRRSKYVYENTKNAFTNNTIEPLNYGLTLNVGYNTFNIHLYYGLNGLLDNGAVLAGDTMALRPFRVGIIFYIL